MSSITQKDLQENAELRYEDISKQEKLTLPQADHKAFILYNQGVPAETAKEYYSYRLTEGDAKKWSIILH